MVHGKLEIRVDTSVTNFEVTSITMIFHATLNAFKLRYLKTAYGLKFDWSIFEFLCKRYGETLIKLDLMKRFIFLYMY